MSKLTICRGLSGSGKSTWSEAQEDAIVVSRDRLRVALFGSDGVDYYQSPDLRSREDYITKVEHAAIRDGLKAGKHVISDNTNIEVRFMKPLAKIAHAESAPVEVKVFDVPLGTALDRNKIRAAAGGRNVPESTIRKQYERFKHTKNHTLPEPPPLPEPYSGTPGKPKALLVDIDGTLAHANGKRGPFDWANVGLDDPDEAVMDVVRTMGVGHDGANHKIIVMSGRDEVCRPQTEYWLECHMFYEKLFMRPEKDMRPDNIVKAELFDKHIRDNYDVRFVIDDRASVVRMWKQMGLKVFNVSGLDNGEF